MTIKAREHKVPCFHPFDKKTFMKMSKADQKKYLKEMAAQLKRQEDGINSLTAIEYKAARDAFESLGRNTGAVSAQANFRDKAFSRIEASIRESLRGTGFSSAEAKIQAAADARGVMSKLDALHDPDMVAGGWMQPNPTRLGRTDVNSSIGASWNQNNRITGMDREAERAIEKNRGNQRMNVKLEPCRGKGMK